MSPESDPNAALRWPLAVFAVSTGIFVLLASGLQRGPVGEDATTLQALELARGGALTELMVAITTFGRGPVTAVIVLALGLFLVVRGHRKEAAFVVLANIGSAILSPAFKAWFQRPRPGSELVASVTNPGGFSFPSGHALSAMVLYASVAIVAGRLGPPTLRRAMIAIAWVMIPLMGFTRAYLGVHYPSDVVAGWALGAAWVSLLYAGYVKITDT